MAVAVLPLARGDDAFQAVGLRVTAGAFLVLVAAVVLCRAALVPLAAVLVGGLYGVELAIDDAPVDAAAAAVAAGLLLAVELAYWSIEERHRWKGDTGDGLRHAAYVTLAAAGAFVLASTLVVVVDAVHARGLALDLLGTAAAAAVLVAILALGRQSSKGS